MPGAGNPAAWNRYGYVMYNPLKYTDPSGQVPCGLNGSHAECAKQHNIQMRDYSPDVEQKIKQVNAEGQLLNPEYFGYDIDASENESKIAVSISLEFSGGIGIGSVGGVGLVLKEGIYPFFEFGESSAIPGEVSLGLDIDIDWDIETLSDFEGEDIEVGLIYSNIWGASVGLSVEPGEGLWGIGRVTGISLSPEFGFGFSGFWNYSIKSVID